MDCHVAPLRFAPRNDGCVTLLGLIARYLPLVGEPFGVRGAYRQTFLETNPLSVKMLTT